MKTPELVQYPKILFIIIIIIIIIMLSMLGKILAEDILKYFFLFSPQNRLDISCKLSS